MSDPPSTETAGSSAQWRQPSHEVTPHACSVPGILNQPFLCRYSEPTKFSIVQVPLPELRDDDILVKVKACGVCGTGELAFFPFAKKFCYMQLRIFC